MHNKIKRNLLNSSIILALMVLPVIFFIPMNFTSNVGSDTALDNENESESLLDNDGFSIGTLMPISSDSEKTPWWNSSWRYRKLINLKSTSDTLRNYQVKISINLTEDYNEGRIEETGSDIRVVNSTNIEIGFWIEDMEIAGDNSTIWVNVPKIPNDSYETIFLYYGNPDAESASSGDLTFDFYDDFTATSLDTNKWQVVDDTGWSIVSGELKGTNTKGRIRSFATFSATLIAETRTKAVTRAANGEQTLGFWKSTSDSFGLLEHGGGTPSQYWYRTDGSWVGPYAYDTFANWHIVNITAYDVGSVKLLIKDLVDGSTAPTPQAVSNAISNEPLMLGKRYDQSDASTTYNNQPYEQYWDWIRVRKYASSEPIVSVGEFQKRASDVTVIVKDEDGRIVPNANVTLVNSTGLYKINPRAIESKITNEQGKVLFEANYTTYNITVTYTIESTGRKMVAYNSSKAAEPLHHITEIFQTVFLEVNMTAIDFEIEDVNEDAVTIGYVKVYYEKGDLVHLAKLNLDENGRTTFRWGGDRARYYYEVYYNNSDYAKKDILLNASYIEKSAYETKGKLFNHTIDVFIKNTNPGPLNPYRINYYIYTNNKSSDNLAVPSYLVNKKILKANISMAAMDDINYVRISYINQSGQLNELEELRVDDVTGSVNIKFEVANLTDSDLVRDDYEMYGLYLNVFGNNLSSPCHGKIHVNFSESWREYNKTALSKLNIKVVKVIDVTFEQQPVGEVIVHVTNGTHGGAGESIVNLTTASTDNNKGYAYGETNYEIPFWYISGRIYNFTLEWFEKDQDFLVNASDQSKPKPPPYLNMDRPYNYTLINAQEIIFDLDTDIDKYKTRFNESSGPTEVIWGEIIFLKVNFTSTSDNWVTTDPVIGADEVICKVTQLGKSAVLKTFDLSPVPMQEGNYSVDIGSNNFSAGLDYGYYTFTVYGTKRGYSTPIPVSLNIKINAKTTAISIHNYSKISEEFTSSNVCTKDFNELFNISVRYYDTATGDEICDANTELYYNWYATSSWEQCTIDQKNPGYYVIPINTSDADNTGTYPIQVRAYHENYSQQENIQFNLGITSRNTMLNRIDIPNQEPKTDGLYHISKNVYVKEIYNFSFSYSDLKTEKKIQNAEVIYEWYKMNVKGERITGVGGSGFLTENSAHNYTLDFKTQTRTNGSYAIFINFKKNNYEVRNALIDLKILIRPTKLNGTDYTGKTEEAVLPFTIYTGEKINFTFDYTSVLTGAKLTSNMVKKYFRWIQIGANNNGTLNLNITSNNRYSLDFNTANREAGDYQLVTYLESTNHSLQVYTINLKIKIRQINFTLSGFTGGQIIIKQGIKQIIQMSLIDNSRGGAPLLSANVTLQIGSQIIILMDDNGDGIYTGIFDSSIINTFFQQETLTGTIIIEKKFYETKEITATIVVRMIDTPFLDGVPLFWVVMGIALIGGVVGSLLTYRYVQLARIPTFVKKTRKISNAIKGRKEIQEALLYPPKEAVAVKLYGEDWEFLGLSLTDILGIEITKAKTLPEVPVEPGKITKEKKEKPPKEKKEKAPKEKKEKTKTPSEAPKETPKKPEETKKDEKPAGGAV